MDIIYFGKIKMHFILNLKQFFTKKNINSRIYFHHLYLKDKSSKKARKNEIVRGNFRR